MQDQTLAVSNSLRRAFTARAPRVRRGSMRRAVAQGYDAKPPGRKDQSGIRRGVLVTAASRGSSAAATREFAHPNRPSKRGSPVLSILFTLLWLIFRNVLSTGELIAMQFISVAIFAPLQELGNIILAYREADASLSSYDALMRRPIERRPESFVEIGPIDSIRFDDVHFRHRGASKNALDGVSFEARLGESIAFVGPSGSGKSTLVKLLVGLYTPESGAVYYNDVSTRALHSNRARRQTGIVAQQTHLFAGTLRENLRFVKADATDGEMIAALEQAACAYLLEKTCRGAARAPSTLEGSVQRTRPGAAGRNLRVR